jgi:capsule polysaccharide export protein KpsE/RkpR
MLLMPSQDTPASPSSKHQLLPCAAAACCHMSVGCTETAEQYRALTTSLQLQHQAHQKAAQIMATQQALLTSRQAQLDAANAAVADMAQQLAAQREELATLREQLEASRTQQGS